MLDLVISSDFHVLEPFDLWEKALLDRFGDTVPRLVKSYAGLDGHSFYCGRETCRVDELMVSGDALLAKLIAAGCEPGTRRSMLDEEGIAAEVLNATWTSFMMRIEDGVLQRACCEVFNDWQAEFCRDDPRRFLGVAMIPIDDVDWAVREVGRDQHAGLARCHDRDQTRAPVPDPIAILIMTGSGPRRCLTRLPVTLHIVTGTVRDPLNYLSPEERPEFPRSYIEIFNEVAPALASEFIFGGARPLPGIIPVSL